MIKTNIDIQKDTKASTLHMTTNIIQVTDIKLEVWNYDYQWSNLSLCLWSKQNMQTLHGSADILTIKFRVHKNKSASLKRIFINETRFVKLGHFTTLSGGLYA